jgi:hypothetical protein
MQLFDSESDAVYFALKYADGPFSVIVGSSAYAYPLVMIPNAAKTLWTGIVPELPFSMDLMGRN